MIDHSELMKNGFRPYPCRSDAERNRILYQKDVRSATKCGTSEDVVSVRLYSINIWMYHYGMPIAGNLHGFEADVQFTSQHGEVFNVTLLDPKSVNAVEAFFHSSWVMMNPVPYGE
jgi:hypothetical protein